MTNNTYLVVQHGDDGSLEPKYDSLDAAWEAAEQLHEQYPDEEIRILTINHIAYTGENKQDYLIIAYLDPSMTDGEKFRRLLDQCHCLNGSNHPCWSVSLLGDEDLVQLYDLAPDLSWIVDEDGLVELTIKRAGLEMPDEDELGEDDDHTIMGIYDHAVEILRQQIEEG